MAKNEKRNNAFHGEKVGEYVAIYKRGDRWHANYQFDGRQIRRSMRTKSKKEARRRALRIEKELLAGDHTVKTRSELLADAIRQHMEHVRTEGGAEKTLSKYQYCFDVVIHLANRRKVNRISQIDVPFVDAYRALRSKGDIELELRPAKPKTVHNDTVTIRQLVNYALKHGMMQDDPLKHLKIKKPKRTPQPCWTREQVELILAESESPYKEIFTFLAETGCRVGEAKWLTWSDVDLDRRLIVIQPKDGWTPKSKDQRSIPISDRLLETLRGMTRRGCWVFAARTTRQHPKLRQFSERRLLAYLKRIVKRLRLSGHLHTFRHSFISFAAVEGVAERVLRSWVGHVDREVLDWYFHLADEQSQAAMKRLSDAANAGSQANGKVSDSAHSQHIPKEEKNEKRAK